MEGSCIIREPISCAGVVTILIAGASIGTSAASADDRGCAPLIVLQPPVSRVVCPTALANFSVQAGGTSLTYRWELETSPGVWSPFASQPTALACTPPAAGGTFFATTPANSSTFLAVRPCEPVPGPPGAVSRFNVRCVITDVCAIRTSPAAVYTVCPADINCAGGVSVQDIFDFLSAWFAGSAIGNFNNDSANTVQDIFDYLSAWFTGC